MSLKQWQSSHPNVAFLYAVIGNALVSIMQVFFKFLTAVISPLQILFMRALTLCLFNCVFFPLSNRNSYLAEPELFRVVIKRMICTSGASAILHYCVKYLPVSTIMTLFNTSPIFVYFIEAYYYKKPFNKVSLTLTLISFAGVILIIQPEFLFGSNSHQSEYFVLLVCLMLLSAMMVGMGFIFVHDTAKKIDILVNLQYSYLGHMFFAAIFGNFHQPQVQFDQLQFHHFLLFVGVVACGFCCQYLLYTSNSLLKPSKVMPFAYSGILAGFLADVYLFETKFDLIAISGIFLTSSGLLGKFLIERNENLNKDKEVKLSETNNDHDSQASIEAERI